MEYTDWQLSTAALTKEKEKEKKKNNQYKLNKAMAIAIGLMVHGPHQNI